LKYFFGFGAVENSSAKNIWNMRQDCTARDSRAARTPKKSFQAISFMQREYRCMKLIS